jgi:23S rRNA (cytidine1920-2'-O)/16S rRNA (cytidine1409-2'-O)-methyltransferase
MVSERVRLDQELVAQGLVASRARAQAMLRAGLVLLNGEAADRPDRLVDRGVRLELRGSAAYVSRGGEKLSRALDVFGLTVQGRACLDVGASTGGFTDVLLQRGAASVIALDVGYGQLAWSIRQDPRVTVLERVNVRYLERLPSPADLAVIDVSFISLRLVLPAVRQLLSNPAEVVALVKPQFEVGRGAVGKGGIVHDVEQHRSVLIGLAEFAGKSGFEVAGETSSPILGAKGNREFFLYLRSHD